MLLALSCSYSLSLCYCLGVTLDYIFSYISRCVYV